METLIILVKILIILIVIGIFAVMVVGIYKYLENSVDDIIKNETPKHNI